MSPEVTFEICLEMKQRNIQTFRPAFAEAATRRQV
jgi:hypothetical protein